MKNIIINEGYSYNNFYNGGEGSKIFKNGRKFLDLSFCAGITNLLGHNSKIFKKVFERNYEKKILVH